jgi:Holliday junction resolvasome RuvABC endonuclease subunit
VTVPILAIDPGATTGWCYLPDEGAIRTGEWAFKGHRAERLIQLEERLTAQILRLSPDVVAMEEPMAFRGSGVVALAGMVAVIEMVCERRKVAYASVHVSTLKKYATGSGKAQKPDMIRAATEALGRDVTEHEADAYFVAMWCRENVTLEAP